MPFCLFKQLFSGQIDTVLAVDICYLDSNFVSEAEHIFDLVDPLFGDLGDVQQTFLSRQDLYKCAKLIHAFGDKKQTAAFFKGAAVLFSNIC